MAGIRKPQRFQIKPNDRGRLEAMLGKGDVAAARVIDRVRILLALDGGKSPHELAEIFPLNQTTIERLRKRYKTEGLDVALFDKWNSASEKMLSKRQEAEIVALVCGPHPLKKARWTYELVAEEAVKRGICERVGRTTIRLLLKSHGIKPWREKNVVHPGSHRRVRREDGGRARSLREATRSQ